MSKSDLFPVTCDQFLEISSTALKNSNNLVFTRYQTITLLSHKYSCDSINCADL